MTAGTLKLRSEFFHRRTKTVAQELLGKTLVRIYKGHRISGRITEVEAYLGLKDKACHSYGGKFTPRTKCMYLMGGHAYVYQIYGIHYCMNVVTRTEKHPEAVLIRALEPLDGVDWMMKFRHSDNLKNLTTGPGKLAEALHIKREQNGISLESQEMWIEDAPKISKRKIKAVSRIGIHYAEEAVEWPLRFYLKDSDFVSKK